MNEKLELRDLFAAAALAGSIAADEECIHTAKTHAEYAYECATSMLAERELPDD